ncbi:MAG: PAS domain S-box protein [Bacteroidales bacterium]|nr:MAG: PAS domain S-box protein [Bacteroidales bacterium]
MKWRLKTKMSVFILSISLVIYVLAIGYISIAFKNRAIYDAQLIADNLNKEGANLVRAHLSEYFGTSRALAQAFTGYDKIPSDQRTEIYKDIIRNVLIENPEYIAVFEQWELNAIDPGYTKPYGRVRTTYYRSGTEILYKTDTLDTEGDDTTGIYYRAKTSMRDVITRPYYYSYELNQALPADEPASENAVLEATIITPILKNGTYVGLTGIDVPLEGFQEIIEEIKPLKQTYTFLVANNGDIVAHPELKNIKKSIAEIYPDEDSLFHFAQKIRAGDKFSFMTKGSKFGKNAYISFVPVKIANTGTPWSMGIVVPVDIIMMEANRTFAVSIFAGFMGLILLTVVIFMISHNITKPLQKTTLLLKNLAKGNLNQSETIPITSGDELGEMANSANKLLEGLKSTAGFAQKIGEGDLKADYTLLSEEDALGNALVEMRDRLKRSTDEIKQQAEELKTKNRELQKLSIVASETDNAIIIMDPQGNIEWVNEGVTKLYGYSYEEIVHDLGSNLHDFSAHPDIDKIFLQCTEQKKSIVYIAQDKSKSGELIWAQTTLTPILDRDGSIIKLVAIDSDIRKIKEAEEEIAKQRDNLQELNAAKDKFFSIIAHDLKNPFSVLLSVTEALLEGFYQLTEDEKNISIQRIHKSANLLFNLLDNLLQWSMSQTGRIKYAPEKTDLRTLVYGNISLLRMNAENKNIKLVTDIPEKTYVYADVDMIKTVFRNLLTNAIKFNNQGGDVKVSCWKKKNFYEISVSDSGIGLSEEDQMKLFRIDVKNKTIGTSKEKGTGLGLILSKEYIEKNGGKIWVSSSPGKGSTFTFTIPVFSDKEVPEAVEN